MSAEDIGKRSDRPSEGVTTGPRAWPLPPRLSVPLFLSPLGITDGRIMSAYPLRSCSCSCSASMATAWPLTVRLSGVSRVTASARLGGARAVPRLANRSPTSVQTRSQPPAVSVHSIVRIAIAASRPADDNQLHSHTHTFAHMSQVSQRAASEETRHDVDASDRRDTRCCADRLRRCRLSGVCVQAIGGGGSGGEMTTDSWRKNERAASGAAMTSCSGEQRASCLRPDCCRCLSARHWAPSLIALALAAAAIAAAAVVAAPPLPCVFPSISPGIAKVLVVGNVATGKTSVINRFARNKFSKVGQGDAHSAVDDQWRETGKLLYADIW